MKIGLELARFAAAHRRLTAAYLADQERRGHVPPGWRFAELDASGHVRARVVYWGCRGTRDLA